MWAGEALAALAVGLGGPVALLPLSHPAWLVGLLSLAAEAAPSPAEQSGARPGPASPLVAHWLPLLLVGLLCLDREPPPALAWAGWVLWQASLAGAVRLLAPGRPGRLVLGLVCAGAVDGLGPGPVVAGLGLRMGFELGHGWLLAGLPGVFSGAEAAMVMAGWMAAAGGMVGGCLAPPAGPEGVLGRVAAGLLLLCSGLAPGLGLVLKATGSGPGGTACFYGLAGLAGLAGYAPLLWWLTGEHPLLWLAGYLLEEPARAGVLLGWAGALAAGCGAASWLRRRAPLIVVRKVFHLLAVLMFWPVSLARPQLMALSYAVALSLLLLLEPVRCFELWPAGPAVRRFMGQFVDQRETGPALSTHLYLLLGCALPHWLVLLAGLPIELGLAGLIVLGLGDAAASAVGKAVGRVRWPGSNKTVEGTAAAVLCCVVCGLACGEWSWLGLAALCWQSVAVCLLEAFTEQLDNLVLPVGFAAGLLAASSL